MLSFPHVADAADWKKDFEKVKPEDYHVPHIRFLEERSAVNNDKIEQLTGHQLLFVLLFDPQDAVASWRPRLRHCAKRTLS